MTPLDVSDLRLMLNLAVLVALVGLSIVLALLVVSQFYTVKILRRIDDRDYDDTLRLAKELEARIERDEQRDAESRKRHEQLPERIAQVIAERESTAISEAIQVQSRLADVAKDTNEVVHATHEVIIEKLDGDKKNGNGSHDA